MGKNSTPSYVLTLKLKPEIFQEHILEKRFNIARQIYNACINRILKQDKKMKHDKEYIENLSAPKGKERNKKFKELTKKYELTEYQLHAFVKPMQHHFKNNIDSFTAQKIATRAFLAYQKLIFENGKQLHFQKYGEMYSVEGKNNKTGIRFKDNNLIWNKLEIPVIIKNNDVYAYQALQNRIKYCRIKREIIKGKIKYYLQLILEGIPPQKFNKETGEIKNPRNNGNVGLDIGISTLAIVSDNKVNLIEFCNELENIDKEKRILQRKLDRQRRANNPNKYNENGTINTKNKDKWKFSNKYRRTRNKLRELQRKLAAKRKLEHEKLANIILQQGNNVKVETMNYKGLQQSKFGKRLGLKAPSMFLEILNRKLKYQKKELIKINTWKVKASQYNPYDDTYKKKSLSQRWQQWNENIKIQRDIFSAWLIKNVDDTLEKIDRQKCLDEFNQFYTNYLIEENRLKQCNNLISSIGF